MNGGIYDLRFTIYAAGALAMNVLPTHADEGRHASPRRPPDSAPQPGRLGEASVPNDYPGVLSTARLAGTADTNATVYPIDLPTTLRLAGARNLDIQIARESLKEAEANRQGAVEQFFPWVAPGITYHRRDGLAQSVPSGVISSANFQSYSPGATVAGQVALGDAIYNSLAAKQLVKVSGQALETQRQDTILSAAAGYFDLVKAKAMVEVARQSIGISQEYQHELHDAVAAGVAFKGDELRVQTQTEQYGILLQQDLEQQRVAAANLAQVLHLDARVELVPLDAGVTALRLFPTNPSLNALVQQAMSSRPELTQSEAFMAASRTAKNGAVYGPLIPSVGAQVFGGGLGGGPDGGPSNFGAEGDALVGVSWRIGPGGLFDYARINATKARLASAQFADAKLKDAVISQVVAGLARVNSTAAQVGLAGHNLGTADETLRLTRQRKQYGVGIVVEDIQAQQALNQARSDFVTAVAENDKAQYALSRAIGTPPESAGPGVPPGQTNH
ncbi:MAG TPA: TolC family protein [Candidatus Acidoferrum sp.]|nr:TolC family protein [Candidatus Acidoferrum sp.]